MEKNLENLQKSPHRRKTHRVRIETPSKSPSRRRSQTPPSRLPKGHDESIAPMSMTDEEFEKKFAKYNGNVVDSSVL